MLVLRSRCVSKVLSNTGLSQFQSLRMESVPSAAALLSSMRRIHIQRFQTVCNSCASIRHQHQGATQSAKRGPELSSNLNYDKRPYRALVSTARRQACLFETTWNSQLHVPTRANHRSEQLANSGPPSDFQFGPLLTNGAAKVASCSQSVCNCQRVSNPGVSSSKSGAKKGGPATVEQLLRMKAQLEKYVPMMLRETTPYELFSQDVVVEDRFSMWPRTHKGQKALGFTTAKYRFLAYAKYTQAKMHIMRIGMSDKDGKLTIRWRMTGYTIWGKHSLLKRARKQANFLSEANAIISRRRADQTLPDENTVRALLREGLLSFQDPNDPDAAWVDGVFEVQVNADGLICRVRIDRMEESKSGAKVHSSNALARLLAALGLAPKTQTLFSNLPTPEQRQQPL